MRIVSISDTHNRHKQLPPLPAGNVLVHAGDFSTAGKVTELRSFLEWFSSHPHDQKILICGNHDKGATQRNGKANLRDWSAQPGHHYLDCTSVTLVKLTDGRTVEDDLVRPADIEQGPGFAIKFWGSPHCRWINAKWAFPHVDDDQENIIAALPTPREVLKPFEKMPDVADVVVTHGPRYGVLDYLPGATDGPRKGPHIGSSGLSDAIRTTRPVLHIHGHIHEQSGTFDDGGGTLTVNAAICDGGYNATNPPRVVDLSDTPETGLIATVVRV